MNDDEQVKLTGYSFTFKVEDQKIPINACYLIISQYGKSEKDALMRARSRYASAIVQITDRLTAMDAPKGPAVAAS